MESSNRYCSKICSINRYSQSYLWITTCIIQLTFVVFASSQSLPSIPASSPACTLGSLLNSAGMPGCGPNGLLNSSEPIAAASDPMEALYSDPSFVADLERSYSASPQYGELIDQCQNYYGYSSEISSSDIQEAIREVLPQLYAYIAADEQIRRTVPGAQFASRFLNSLAYEAQFFTLITQTLQRTRCLNRVDLTTKMPKMQLKAKMYRDQIDKFAVYSCKNGHDDDEGDMLNCNPKSKYPAYDGSCNNLRRPTEGMAFTCHRRLLPPDYADGILALRASVTGEPLPNPRLISNELLPDINEVDPEITQMAMQWGQLMVHDMVRTPITMSNAPECCPPSPQNHPECETISPFPPGDSLTKIFNQTCARNTRSNSCPRCKLGPRQQTNAAPHGLDLSNVYGYTYADNLPLRSFENGKLRTERDALGGEIMMVNRENTPDPLAVQACNVPPMFPQFQCFLTGDGIRGNQHPALTALQTIVVRRHNQHADALARVNPHWSDEIVFWEARRLLVAEYNHISYAEYFPALFSEDILRYFNLLPLKYGYTKYEPDTDHSSIHEWATAAGRFGHSQINDVFIVKNENEHYPFRLKDVFFEMSLIHLGQADGILRGMATEPAFEVDPFFVIDVKNFLYQLPNRTTGLDLVSINVLRGRDHGIPSYINYLDYCFGYKVDKWEDLYEYIPKKQVDNMQTIYTDVRDVDLFVGGVSERRLPGNAMGPTFSCINGVQWYHIKFGDRFFYEHGGESGSFTPDQLQNIRETTTAARLICKVTKNSKMPMNVFKLISHSNPDVDCDSLPEIDYDLWKDHGAGYTGKRK
ncbi:peroxidase-like [Brevipalpus obovatus]|uniref:peroxidase-like n=1 Tax=Brevipalpus obovatus TaxID=246614 RepID=UPI003D9EF2CC